MKRRRRFAEGDLVENSIDDLSFKEAFKRKRKELGEGKTFTWRGDTYTTAYKKPEAKVESKPDTVKTVAKPLTSKQEKTVGQRWIPQGRFPRGVRRVHGGAQGA